ncbi:MAG TPA: Hpt domain-containing protein [Pilimelia sp.]|nr:Hpt domain-containing protein [Pilimelia sp.]
MTTDGGTAAAIHARVADLIEDDDPDDVAFVERLISSFLARAPGMLASLDDALAAGDAALAAHWAHAIKGAAANIGADAVAEIGADAERLADAGELPDARDHPVRLRAALAATAPELTGVMAGLRRRRGG